MTIQNKIMLGVLLASLAMIAITAIIWYIYAAYAITSNDFSTGYSDGNQQGLMDKHSNVFHIGNACLSQSNSYCNGYISGYLDGFFAHGFSSTKIIVEHHTSSSHPKHG
jgi:hypothetical protein